MTLFAVSTAVAILSVIGLVVGLVVLVVVIGLLNSTLAPLRQVLGDVQDAKTVPMLEHGVKGLDQLSRTQQLANSVPPLAVAYLQKLNLPVDTEAPARTFPEPGRGGWR